MEKYEVDRGKIKGFMAEYGLTQNDMAVHTDMSRQSMIAKLNGRSPFDEHDLCKIADIFGENPSIFFTRVVDRANRMGTRK